MYKTISDLQEFYSTTRGKVVARAIRKKISKVWKPAKGDRVVGFGYPLPYVGKKSYINKDADIAISLFSEESLVNNSVNNIVKSNENIAICSNKKWPIESNSINRVVVVHSAYSEKSLFDILSEAWRVLVAEGRILIVVPNRSGIWARIDNNPFGVGSPYSMPQIRDILKKHKFNPEREERALFFPPTDKSRFILGTYMIWENIGSGMCNALGGVNIIEANKRIYAGDKFFNKIKQVNQSGVLLPTGSIRTSSTHKGMLD